MAKVVPFRHQPKNLPDDFRDESLHRAAVSFNADKHFPAKFTEESLAYLWELGDTLPRRGIFFITAAKDFISELASGTLPEPQAGLGRQMCDLRQRKEAAISISDFELAAALRDQQDKLRAKFSQYPIHQITPDEIRIGLARVGVDADAGPSPCAH